MDATRALTEAIAVRDAAALVRLFAAGVDPATVDDDGLPFVLAAADSGDLPLVQAFLDAGLPVDADGGHECGTTALICAAQAGHLPLVELLLARGADPNRVEHGDVETATALTRVMELPDPTPLVAALLDAGADPNLPRPDGWTPLMLAASFGHEALVRRLLDTGVNVNASGYDGELNALGAARHRGHEEIIRLLLAHGAAEPVEPGAAHLPQSQAELDAWLATHPRGTPPGPPPGQPHDTPPGLPHGPPPGNPPGPLHETPPGPPPGQPHDTPPGLPHGPPPGNPPGPLHGTLPGPLHDTPHDDDAEVDACAARLAGIVDDIIAWFAEHAPPAAARLEEARGGTDPAEIAAAEATLGVRLPAGFRAYLRLFGGTDGLTIAEYDGLSLSRALHAWQCHEDLRADGVFATWPPREVGPDNGYVRFTWWHPAWLPFAQDGAGNLFCIDLDPAERGTVGQVISWEVHGGPAGPVVPSIEAYLRRYLHRLRAGEYDFNPATGFQDGG